MVIAEKLIQRWKQELDGLAIINVRLSHFFQIYDKAEVKSELAEFPLPTL